MAFVPNDPTQDPNKQQQSGSNPLGQQAPVATSSAPGAGPSGQAAAGAGGQASNQNTGQPFTNLQAYLTANAPQISQQANTISGNLQSQYGQIQNQIQSGVNDFGQQVQSGYAAPNQDLVNQATSNPTEFVKNPQNVSAFQSQLNDAYSGPTDFASSPTYANLNKTALTAAQQADLVNTPEGLQTYLRQGNNNSTAGENLLDQVLLSGSPESIKQIQGAAAPFKGLGDYLSDQATQANQGITTAQQAAQQASQFANQGLTQAETGLSDRVGQELARAQEAGKLYNTDVDQLRGVAGDYVSQIQNYLAQNPNLKSQLADLSPWANLQQIGAPTAANAASPYDYSELAALGQLSGQPFNAPINAADAAQGGTFALPKDLEAAISSGAVPAAMTQELLGLQNQIQGAYQPYQNLINQEMKRVDVMNQAANIQNQINGLKKPAPFIDDPVTFAPIPNPAFADYQKRAGDLQAQYDAIASDPNYSGANYWPQISQTAQGLQWLPQAATGYNDLVSAMNAKLQGLGSLNVPNLPPPDVNQQPLPQAATAGNAAATAIGAGAPAATAAGLLSGAAPTTASALATSGATVAGEAPLAGLSGFQAAGPAALAAYGASNIGQNVAANPIPTSLATLGNMGLSLATLSIPPKILDSIGSGLKNVINSISDFFGGLF